MKTKYRDFIILFIIIFFQVLVISYWTHCKTNYHVDELYSMGHASGFTGLVYTSQYITTSRDFKMNEWIENSVYKKYLTVSEQERAFNAPLYRNIISFFKYKNYFGLLNVVESIANNSEVSAIPGICLNIIFLFFSEILLVRFMKKLKMDEVIRILAVTMFGFTGYMISMVLYIRFYMFIIMLMILMLNCFYTLWKTDSWKQIVLSELVIAVCAYLSFKNSEFTMPFLGAFGLGFVIALLMRRKWKQLLTCSGACSIGLFIIWDYVKVLINPAKDYDSISIYDVASTNISQTSFDTIKHYFYWLKELMEFSFFGSRTIVYILLGAMTIALIISSMGKDRKAYTIASHGVSPVTLWSVIIWLGIFGVSVVLGHGKFICIVILYVIIILGVTEYSGFTPSFKRIYISDETQFILILACEALLFTLFDALCRYEIWRYYCYGFVSVFIVFWYITDRLLKRKFINGARTSLIVILAVFVIVNAFLPFKERRIECIFEDDKTFIDNVKNNQDLDVVLVLTVEEGEISRHETYDCINIMPEHTNIFVVDEAEFEESGINLPDEFILWAHNELDVDAVLNNLEDRGYYVRELGSDHCSKAYVLKGSVI